VGHTKFSPDGYFGLIKKTYRRSKVYTYDHLVEVINSSTTGKYNICQAYGDDPGHETIRFRKWSSWLGKRFNSLPGITQYQHFHTAASAPGRITVRQSAHDEEKTFSLLKDQGFQFSGESAKPPCFKSRGLSAKRQWYLYDNIRPHILNKVDQDATAPKPRVQNHKRKDQEK